MEKVRRISLTYSVGLENKSMDGTKQKIRNIRTIKK